MFTTNRSRPANDRRDLQKGMEMTIGASLAVIIVGILLAALVNSTLGWIVVAVGVIGLILSLVTAGRTRTY